MYGDHPDAGEVAELSAGYGQKPRGPSGIQEPALDGFHCGLFFHVSVSFRALRH